MTFVKSAPIKKQPGIDFEDIFNDNVELEDVKFPDLPVILLPGDPAKTWLYGPKECLDAISNTIKEITEEQIKMAKFKFEIKKPYLQAIFDF